MFHGVKVGWGGWEEARLKWRNREHCTVPDQLLVDKELEFRVEVWKTDTEGGPVVGREHREEVVDRGTVSTTHKRATDKVNKATFSWIEQKHTHIPT